MVKSLFQGVYVTFLLMLTFRRITNGIWATYSTMAVRTSGPGPGGLSLIVVPLLGNPGVTMRRLDTGGQVCAGTTFIELDDVKVPVENLIGKEGMGMKYIMTNFNHERLAMAIGATRLARVALSAAFEYCMHREAFGKPLLDQPVVRHRLAKCGALLESQWAWVEQFTYLMCVMPNLEVNAKLGGLTALSKAQAGMVLDEWYVSLEPKALRIDSTHHHFQILLIFAGQKCKVRRATIWGQRVYDDGAGENRRSYALVTTVVSIHTCLQ